MNEEKPWWQSRTVWASLVGVLFIVARNLGILPEGLSEAHVVELVLTITSVLAVIFRVKAKSAVQIGK